MKKNMLTIIILAISLLNMVLSAVIVFTVVPSSQKTSRLIDQVASAVSLELAEEGRGGENVSVEDTEVYTISKELTLNLKRDTDNVEHYGMLDSVTVSMNSKAKDFKSVNANMEKSESYILDTVSEVISGYTYDSITQNREEVKAQCLETIKKHFDTECIYDISFGNLRFQ